MNENKYFHPETLKRISRLDLRARHVVDGFLSGMHKSRHFGNSVEFRQHRQYVAGDDLRSVDWKIWAKQDRLFVKQYEVDTNMRVTLLVDVSQSMRFGGGAMSKYEYACTAAASLAYLAIRQQDAVGCITFDKATRDFLPSKMKQSHLIAISEVMFRSAPEAGAGGSLVVDAAAGKMGTGTRKDLGSKIELSDLLADVKGSQPEIGDVMRKVAESIRSNSLVVIFSDLLMQRDGLFKGLRYLKSKGHDVMVLHIMDDMEIDFTLGGPTRFEGLELPVQIRCDPRMLRDGYIEAVNAYLEEVQQGCSKLMCDYSLFRTSVPLDAAIAAYLSRRNLIVRNLTSVRR
ncbi:MAG: DUF58 domain-containing protein [Planctomycetaceae bacterium]|jgi:uncharacterized protein (DUF58 family)|nr:DUF58 domain-containing protein [Planctomycetaceae bacterium]